MVFRTFVYYIDYMGSKICMYIFRNKYQIFIYLDLDKMYITIKIVNSILAQTLNSGLWR